MSQLNHLRRVFLWLVAIEMLLQPILLAIPTDIVRAAEPPMAAEIESAIPMTDEGQEPLTVTIPAPPEEMNGVPAELIQTLYETAAGNDPAYQIHEANEGEHQATNPRQNFIVKFTKQGIKITTEDGGVLNLRLQRYGFDAAAIELADQLPEKSNKASVSYERGPLTEWYINSENGLKQGFTIDAPPSAGSGELIIEYHVSGNLEPTLSEGGQSIVFARKNEVAGQVLEYSGLAVYDAHGDELPATLELTHNNRLVLRVDVAGAAYPVVVDPNITEYMRLLAPDGNIGDKFGYSVAIDKNTIVIGTDNSRAYVFVRDGAKWTYQATLLHDESSTFNRFGKTVAISGNTIAISDPSDDSCGYDNAGAIYVFVREGVNWSLQTKLCAQEAGVDDQLGYYQDIAIDGDVIVVGNRLAGSNQGAVYTFVRNGSTWTEGPALTHSSNANNIYFGQRVELSNNLLGVLSSSSTATLVLYQRTELGWTEIQSFSDSSCLDYIDFALDSTVTNNTLTKATLAIVSHSYNTTCQSTTPPHASIWSLASSEWVQVDDILGNWEEDLDIEDNILILSTESSSNIVNVYQQTNNDWVLSRTLVSSPSQTTTYFGWALDIDEGTIVVSDHMQSPSGYRGAVMIYEGGIGQWTWMDGTNTLNEAGSYGAKGIPSETNAPPARQEAATWSDTDGNLWLFGGQTLGFGSPQLNDLWKYDGENWTWISGTSTPHSQGSYPQNPGTTSPDIYPSARVWAASWVGNDGKLWLFGGVGRDSAGAGGSLNDLWSFDPASGMWTWVGGSKLRYAQSSGAKGTSLPTNFPGARYGATGWVDQAGNLWLFGGDGDDSLGAGGTLNELWKYNISTGIWTWVGGSESREAGGIYGAKGQPSTSNFPGARMLSMSATDAEGNFWLYGGIGSATLSGNENDLSDLWRYKPSTGEWTWMSGTSSIDQPGIYGTQGIAAANNRPGARFSGELWVDNSGNIWLFGGRYSYPGVPSASLNDLWKLDLSSGLWTWKSGSNAGNQPGTYPASPGIASWATVPGARYGFSHWIDDDGNLWIYSGDGYGTGSTSGNLSDFWRYQLTLPTPPPTPTVPITASSGGGTDWPVNNYVPGSQGYVGNPINTYNGNQTFETVDLRLPTAAGEIYFSRSYSSFNAYFNYANLLGDSLLGVGWQHNYETRLVLLDCIDLDYLLGCIDIITPGGSTVRFVKPGIAGGFVPHPEYGGDGKLEYFAPIYRYTNTDGVVLDFHDQSVNGRDGKLARIQYFEDGSSIELSYEGEAPYRLTEVRSVEDNQFITLGYGDECTSSHPMHVEMLCTITVNGNNDRKIEFDYTITEPQGVTAPFINLTANTDLRGQVWSYRYATPQNQSISEADFLNNEYLYNFLAERRTPPLPGAPDGQSIIQYKYQIVTEINVDSDDRPAALAVGEINGLGQPIVDLTYGNAGREIAYGGSTGPQITQLYYPDGRLRSEQIGDLLPTEYEYDTNQKHRLAEIIDPNGNRTIYDWTSTGSDRVDVENELYRTLSFVSEALGLPEFMLYPLSPLDDAPIFPSLPPQKTWMIYNTETVADPAIDYLTCDPNNYTEIGCPPLDDPDDPNDDPNSLRIDNPNAERLYPTLSETLLLERIDNYRVSPTQPDMNLVTRYFYYDIYDPNTGAVPGMVQWIDVETPGGDVCYKYNEFRQVSDVYEACTAIQDETIKTLVENIGGRHTHIEYDEHHRIDEITDADDRVTKYMYRAGDLSDLPYQVIQNYKQVGTSPIDYLLQDTNGDVWNIATAYFYDSAGRVTAVVENYVPATDSTPAGDNVTFMSESLRLDSDAPEATRITLIEYDGASRVVMTTTNHHPGKAAYTDGYNFSVRMVYDAAGRAVAMIENYKPAVCDGQSGSPIKKDLDGDGTGETCVVVSPDAPDLNFITLNRYNSVGRVVEVIASAWFDPDGSLGEMYHTVQNAEGDPVLYNLSTAYEYDAVGNVVKTIVNYDPTLSSGLYLAVDPELAPDGVLRVDPAQADRNIVTCVEYDALNRPVYVRQACVDGNDYQHEGGSIYNLLTYFLYDHNSQPLVIVENFKHPNYPRPTGIIDESLTLVITPEYNHVTRLYYDDLGRTEWVVREFVGDAVDPEKIPVGSSSIMDMPDHNIITRHFYHENGLLIAEVANYREDVETPDDGDPDPALLAEDVEDGYPEFNQITRYFYNGAGQITEVVGNYQVTDDADPTGLSSASTLEFVAADVPFSTIYPDQNLVTHYPGYDALSRPTQFVVDRGTDMTNTQTFDNLGRVRQAVFDQTGLNQITTTIYEQLGYVITVRDPEGREQRIQYDVRGNETIIIDPDTLALTSENTYDRMGRVTHSETVLDNQTQVIETRYDALGRVVAVVADPDGLALTTTYEYDLLGRIRLTHEHLADDDIISTMYVYDNLGSMTRVYEDYFGVPSCEPYTEGDDPTTNTCTRYQYDDIGNLTQVTLGNGSIKQYQYDALGRVRFEVIDPADEAIFTQHCYTNLGTIERTIKGSGRTTAASILCGDYQPASYHFTDYTYDALARARDIDYRDFSIEETSNDPVDVHYSYERFGNRQKMEQPSGGDTWYYTSRNDGLITKVCTDWDGGTCLSSGTEINYEYDFAGNLLRLHVPEFGIDTRYQYDSANRLECIYGNADTDCDDTTDIRYSYEQNSSRLNAITLPNGVETTFEYDSAGRLKIIDTRQSAADPRAYYEYTVDARGNRTDAIEQLILPGDEQSTSAPSITNPAQATFNTGVAGSITITANGAPTPDVSIDGLPAWLTFDQETGLLSGTPPVGSDGTYSLTITAINGIAPDAVQNFTLTVITPIVFTSNASKIFTVGVNITHTFTATGNPLPTFSISGSLPSGLSFDSMTGTISGTAAVGTVGTYPLTITAANGVVPSATQSFTLVVEKPASAGEPGGNGSCAKMASTVNVKLRDMPVGRQYSYTLEVRDATYVYMTRQFLATFAGPAGTQINFKWIMFPVNDVPALASPQTYNSTWTSLPNPVTLKITSVDRTTHVQGQTTYSYNCMTGVVTQTARTVNLITTWPSLYAPGLMGSAGDQLTMGGAGKPMHKPAAMSRIVNPISEAPAAQQADSGVHRWHYEYDDLGRLLYACEDWDSVNAECDTLSEWTYTYDGAGNLLEFSRWDALNSVTTVRFVYNGANQIVCVDDISADGLCNDGEFLYQYDNFGNLLSDGVRTYTYDLALRLESVTVGGVTTTYEYNGDGDRIAQMVGGVRTDYILDVTAPLTQVLAETTSGVTTTYTYGMGLVSQKRGSGTPEYFATDGLGSVRQMLGSLGEILETQTYDPFGNLYSQSLRSDPPTGFDDPSFGYTGEQEDSNGLTYLRARYYNPAIGRFTQIDPFDGAISMPASLNGYGYVAGNPTNYVDPNGMCYGWAEFARDYAPIQCGNFDNINTILSPGSGANAGERLGALVYTGFAAVGLAAGVVGGGILLGKAALACMASFVCQTLDYIDDASTYAAAASGDPQAAAQVQVMNSLGLQFVPFDLPINFAASKVDDVIDVLKYANNLDYKGVGGDTGLFLTTEEFPLEDMAWQEKRMSCVAACIRELLSRHGITISEEDIRTGIGTHVDNGTSFNSRVDNWFNTTLRQHGIEDAEYVAGAPMFETEQQALAWVRRQSKLGRKYAWIAQVKQHAIIVESISKKDELLISDPQPRNWQEGVAGNAVGYTVTWGSFFNKWSRAHFQSLARSR